MEEIVNIKKYSKKYAKECAALLWCFWNVLVALVPVLSWSILTKSPIDLWTGTISCACALSGSVAFSVIYTKDKDWDSRLTQCIATFLVGLMLLLVLFSFKEVDYFKEVIIDSWYCSYFIFFMLLLTVIFITFRNEFENLRI